MPISLALIMGLIGMAVAMLIGIMIFAQVDDSIVCPSTNSTMGEQCENVKSTTWTIIGILPIALFFVMFMMFGGFGGAESEVRTLKGKVKRKHTLHWKILVYLGLAKVRKQN